MKKEADKRTVTHVSQNERTKSASKSRKQKHHKRDVIVAFLVIVFLLAAVVVAGVALLKVGSVSVAGNDGIYADDRIVEIAGITSESSILTLREEKIAETVCFALPYIQSVELVRTLPDSVTLQVQYAEPAFAVDCGQIWLILSEEGKILETMQAAPSGITELQGVLVSDYTVGKTAVFNDALYFNHAASVYAAGKENDLGDIRTLKVDQSGYVTMNIDNRFFVQSGSVHILLKEMAVLKQVMLEREAKKTAFTFTLAADGSITISNRDDPIEEEPTEMNQTPDLDMDSELVDSDDDAQDITQNQTDAATETTDYDYEDSDSVG